MDQSIKVKVTKEGVVVPREMLGDAKTVEITLAGNGVLIVTDSPPVISSLKGQLEDVTLSSVPPQSDDPVLQMGQNPVECGLVDASERHDDYLYGNL